jgi:PAN domain
VISEALSSSQFPVFTIYAQKSCLMVKPCERAWCFDRVPGYTLKGYTRATHQAASRQECLELCLGEREFPCRSVISTFYTPTERVDITEDDIPTLELQRAKRSRVPCLVIGAQ